VLNNTDIETLPICKYRITDHLSQSAKAISLKNLPYKFSDIAQVYNIPVTREPIWDGIRYIIKQTGNLNIDYLFVFDPLAHTTEYWIEKLGPLPSHIEHFNTRAKCYQLMQILGIHPILNKNDINLLKDNYIRPKEYRYIQDAITDRISEILNPRLITTSPSHRVLDLIETEKDLIPDSEYNYLDINKDILLNLKFEKFYTEFLKNPAKFKVQQTDKTSKKDPKTHSNIKSNKDIAKNKNMSLDPNITISKPMSNKEGKEFTLDTKQPLNWEKLCKQPFALKYFLKSMDTGFTVKGVPDLIARYSTDIQVKPSPSLLIKKEYKNQLSERPHLQINIQYKYAVICNFLSWILADWELTIGKYFRQMHYGESFFLIAATGLGKTVGTPIFLLAQALTALLDEVDDEDMQDTLYLTPDTSPKIWVVVPTIVIAKDSADALNKAYQAYLKLIGVGEALANVTVLYGCRTSKFKLDYHAPIQFITTGILPIYTNNSLFRRGFDTVLIDEAHNTIPRDESMELAISSLWSQGITVSYMSATVGIKELESRLETTIINAVEDRFPKFFHDSLKPLIPTVLETIQDFFIERNERSSMFPPNWYKHKYGVLQGTNPKNDPSGNRASGILVVVDSFNGKSSDAVNLRETILPLCAEHGIEVLGFASSVRDDDEKNKIHEEQFNYVINNNKQYVIITTNVIEMGITWPTLDVVITMDSELVNELINGFSITLKTPISAAAIGQRGGRVGRKRPGIVIITHENATYDDAGKLIPDDTRPDDELLNTTGLEIAQIKYPLTRFEPYKFSYELITNGCYNERTIVEYISKRSFPSIANIKEIGYIVAMTIPIVELYGQLDIHTAKYADMLPILHKKVGDPMYPWLLTGWKMMQDNYQKDKEGENYYNFGKYSLIFFAWLGINFAVPSKRIVKPIHREFNKQIIPFSDLLSLAIKDTPLGSGFTKEELAYVHDAEDDDWDNNGLWAVQMNKNQSTFTYLMYDLIQDAEKQGYEEINPLFFRYFVEGTYMHEDEYMGEQTADSGSAVGVCFHYFNRVRPQLETLYRLLGTKFTFTKELELDKWEIQYEFEGQTMTEVVDACFHFVKPNTTDTFYGVLLPSTNRDRTAVLLTMEHWYNMSMDKADDILKVAYPDYK
jgi:hypothetical protein